METVTIFTAILIIASLVVVLTVMLCVFALGICELHDAVKAYLKWRKGK